ncbi:MAG: 3-phosphoshikimate 1-carboxyvinyltransferase [Vicinamibacterales bacterium]
MTTVRPARRVHGVLRVPGDKSIAHRYAIFAAIARGSSEFENFAPGADCRSTLTCIEGLGARVEFGADRRVTVIPPERLLAPAQALDCGNSGSTMRMLAGVIAAQPFRSRMVGDASLSRRPMRRVIDPLARMGARIQATDGHAPLTIDGGPLAGMAYRPEVPSAQVKSAVLLAGLHAEGTTSVTEPAQTRDHTERAMIAFGLTPRIEGLTVSVQPGGRAQGQKLTVPGDFSSAAFWLVAAAALPGSRIEIAGVGLNPTRTALLDVLRRFGARVTVHQTATGAGEPLGTIVVEGDRTGSVDIAPEEVPGLIDELPAIAALAARTGTVTVRGASELRVKESDRIAALVAGFRALGIDAEELADGFVIHGKGSPHGGVADAQGDHRMAMAFAVAALAADGPSHIEGADAVVISYPGFFDTLGQLVA